jgi:hypothetical protein
MTQAQRDEIFRALGGGTGPAALDQAVGDEVATLEPIIDRWLVSYVLSKQKQLDLIDALQLAIEMIDLTLRTTFSQDALLDQGRLLEKSGKRIYQQLTNQKQRFAEMKRQFEATCDY